MPSDHRLSLYFAGIGREVVFRKSLYLSSATWAMLLSSPEQVNFSQLATNDPFTQASGHPPSGVLFWWSPCLRDIQFHRNFFPNKHNLIFKNFHSFDHSMGHGSLTRGQTCTPCIGSMKSSPLNLHGSPQLFFYRLQNMAFLKLINLF